MRCARCGMLILNDRYMVEKIDGRLVTTHFDCGSIFETVPKGSSFEEMMRKAKKDFTEKKRIIKKRRGF